MSITNRQLNFNGREVLNGLCRVVDQFVIERFIQTVILLRGAAPRHTRGHGGQIQQLRKIEPLRLPVFHRVAGFQKVYAAHHFIHLAEAQLRHNLPNLFGNKEEEINGIFRLACKLRP